MAGNLVTSLPLVEAPACVGRLLPVHVETLTDGLTLDATYPNVLKLDPGGSARIVVLPDVEAFNGVMFSIINAADADEDLTVNNASASTIGTVGQNKRAEFWSDGTNWNLTAITTIALS